jgi:hypothetical protein
MNAMTLHGRIALRVATLGLLIAALVGCGGQDTGTERGPRRHVDPGATTDDCKDSDGDGISDAVEGDADTDSDKTPDREDADSDGDGIADKVERAAAACAVPLDSDRDGIFNFRDLDSDGDGVPDAPASAKLDSDKDGVPDYLDRDDDNDKLLDIDEIGDDPSMPRDSDGDGTPDVLDTDSDGDGILDGIIPKGLDTDNDGTPDFRDDDDDGDGIADALEVGADPSMPRDTDGDGTPDHQDADSDDDGMADNAEDKNGNGKVDPGETDPLAADTDGDGADDLIEASAGTDPNDASANPQVDGNFVFVVPYKEDPAPPRATLDFTTDIVKADLVFSIDTTGSMGEEIVQLQTSLSQTIIPQLTASIPDLGLGVAWFRDFPVTGFGDATDVPFQLAAPVTTDAMKAQTAVNGLAANGGGDGPEAGVEALYQLASGAGVAWTGGMLAAQDIGWRPGALPIIVQISDASMQDNATYMGMIPAAATRAQAKDALGALGAKVIGVASAGGSGDVTGDLLNFINATNTSVPTDAFGTSGQCLTGISGAAVAPVGGVCPLLFNVDATGAGLGTTVVDGVKAVVNYAALDIDARPENETGNVDAKGKDVDAVDAFLDRVEPNTKPAKSTGCAKGLGTDDRLASDGIDDTFVDVTPGAKVCFDVIAKENTTVKPAGKPQLFKARIDVMGDGVTTLDSRQVWFLVPPVPPKPGDAPPVQ